MNSSWHIVINAFATFIWWCISPKLNLTIHPVLIALSPLAVLAGVFYPDLDQRTPLMRHRSWITHSAVIGLLLIIDPLSQWIGGWEHCTADILIHQFCFSVGVHLLCDLKSPKKMKGFALIHIPIKNKKGKIVGEKEVKKKIKKPVSSKLSIFWLLFHGLLLCWTSVQFL